MNSQAWRGILAAGIVALTGCESTQSRLKEREATARGWSPVTRERVTRGEIKPGDDYDMVYVALGQPGDIETITVRDGGVLTIWNYPKIVQRQISEETVDYEEITEFDVRTGQRLQYRIPVREGVYETSKQQGLQVIFRDGLVTSVRWGRNGPPAAASEEN
ncbi:hypothetical protein [Actomonas aquatica]|uniref:Lipoprotein n=1 Tax=Actomonas aquatica TaxID=2866162 RepID=A0ABZ1CD68_9BACT|nr:hypothetical protein [Opitutus sp. WL0086]WRQ89624.1 hypothetical protein K1X11_009400 [Opitutus sp. WL0086]